jgi:DNA repair exonuclease SbcCD ATPase subunit
LDDQDDDEGDQPSSRANRNTDDLSDLREQIAALQKQIQQLTTAGNRATSTESAGGSGVAPPADAGSRLFAKTRAKLEEARAKYGDEMAADLGIPELLEELQAIIEPVHAAARQRQEQEQAEIANAEKQINRYLNSVAQASPEIGRLLGDGKTLSRRQQAFREDVIQTAREIQEQSMRRVRAGRADKPVSDREALDRAVAELTGVSVPQTSTDARVRDRARMVTPAGNGSAGRSQKPTGIAQAEMFINQFLAARRQEDAA